MKHVTIKVNLFLVLSYCLQSNSIKLVLGSEWSEITEKCNTNPKNRLKEKVFILFDHRSSSTDLPQTASGSNVLIFDTDIIELSRMLVNVCVRLQWSFKTKPILFQAHANLSMT